MIIKRDNYLNQLIANQHNGLIKVVTGLRRSGKSYLLFHLFGDYLKEQGKSKHRDIFFASALKILRLSREGTQKKNHRFGNVTQDGIWIAQAVITAPTYFGQTEGIK